jgi:hypothetical protein
MTEKYGEIKIMNQDEYIKYYNKNKPRRDSTLEISKIYYRNHTNYNENNKYYYSSEWPDGNSMDKKNTGIVVYDSTEPIVYLKSDQILSIENNKKLLDNLTKNNSYIIHVIGIEYLHIYTEYQEVRQRRKSILFIDNCCNYYEIKTGNINEDYYHKFTTNNIISNIQLPNSIIDSIKNMKDIISNNNHIHQYLDLLRQINQTLLYKLDEQSSQIQDLQSKLDAQTKLNETLCKRLFELKN